jgi:uncharacterized protein YyaL (SSP411 family)
VRDRRPAPFVDLTLYSGWVALVASGHFAAARYAGIDEAAPRALGALERCVGEGFHASRGVVHRLGDPASGELLEDQAYLASALLDAFEWTQDGGWLERARAVLHVLVDRFRDPASGAMLDRPRDADATVSALAQPHMPIADAPAPAGNAMAALALLRMWALTHDQRYLALGSGILRAFGGSAPRLGASAATWVKALGWTVTPVTSVVIVDDADATHSRLLRSALAVYRPRTTIRYFSPATVRPESLPPDLRAMVTADAPRGYLCAGQVCAAPVTDPAQLIETMRTFRV